MSDDYWLRSVPQPNALMPPQRSPSYLNALAGALDHYTLGLPSALAGLNPFGGGYGAAREAADQAKGDFKQLYGGDGLSLADPFYPSAARLPQAAANTRHAGNALMDNMYAPGTPGTNPALLYSGVGPAAPTRALDDLGYYSQAFEAAKAWPQGKGTPEQALMWLKKSGTKDAEIAATNLSSFLEGKRSISRDDLVAHLEGNRVGLTEKVYDKGPGEIYVDPAAWGDSVNQFRRFTNAADAERYAVGIGLTPDHVQKMYGGDAKFSSYSLDPSNPTYRETVLHLPGETPERARAAFEALNRDVQSGRLTQEEGMRRQAELERIVSGAENSFQSGHFPEPNIIGHMMTSMTKHDGRPVYTIDQIQSDWGQRLRDGGVRDEAKIAELKSKLDEAQASYDQMLQQAYDFLDMKGMDANNHISVRSALNRAGRIIEHLSVAAKSRDPNISQGAEDLLARFDDAIGQRNMLRAEYNTANTSAPGHPLVNTTDQWVNTTLRRGLQQAADANADYVAIPSGKTVLSYNPGDDHGMSEFYDKIVPKNLGNILSKLDKNAQRQYVDQLMTPGKGPAGAGFSIFQLTPELRAKIKQGLPLFSMAPLAVGSYPSDDRPTNPLLDY